MKLVERLRETADMLARSVGTEADVANVRQAIARIEAADPWTRFGDAVFEKFWNDGYPGDVDGGDLQEIASECGLLRRTTEVGPWAMHSDGCGWESGMPPDDCDCFTPLPALYRAIVREQDGGG